MSVFEDFEEEKRAKEAAAMEKMRAADDARELELQKLEQAYGSAVARIRAFLVAQAEGAIKIGAQAAVKDLRRFSPPRLGSALAFRPKRLVQGQVAREFIVEVEVRAPGRVNVSAFMQQGMRGPAPLGGEFNEDLGMHDDPTLIGRLEQKLKDVLRHVDGLPPR